MATEETVEIDPTIYLEKAPTALQARFGDWIKDEVGYNPTTAKTKEEAFREGVRIATATRMVFQASDYNRNANEAARREREAARKAAIEEVAPAPVAKKAPAAKAAPAKKAPAKKAAAPVAVEETEEAAPAAVKPARRPARRTAAATTVTAEAPF